MSIAILCSGGDSSGMNPAIKRFVEYSYERGIAPYFIYNGFDGLIDGDIAKASFGDVGGIIARGGTVIGSSRSERFFQKKHRKRAYENLSKHGINRVVALGGDGTFRGVNQFSKEHNVAFAAIPATIDNDIYGTQYAIGVDTALNVIRDAIDNIRDTASSFKRAFVIETMGRDCGYLALVSALTGGAEMCLIPEVEYNLESLKERFSQESQEGRSYFVAIVAEGVKGSEKIKEWFESEIGVETRLTILGHIQRGGNPTSFERLMAVKFITYGVDLLLENINNTVVTYNDAELSYMRVEKVVSKKSELDSMLLAMGARLMGK